MTSVLTLKARASEVLESIVVCIEFRAKNVEGHEQFGGNGVAPDLLASKAASL